jgi:hypothetical protein
MTTTTRRMMMRIRMKTTWRAGGPVRCRRRKALVRSVALAALALGGAAGCATAQAGGGDTGSYEWRGAMPAGGTLEIKGVNGTLHVRSAGGSEVVVSARLRGRRSDPATVRVERVEHAGGLTFCAVYPTPSGERANSCEPGEGGRMNTRRNDVEVEFNVEVPAGVPFRGRTVNGSVNALDLDSDVDVATVNGSVEVSTTRGAQARTVNGSIEARFGGPLRQDASFETVNGRITLAVPRDLNANLEARWLNGGLESDIPISMSGRMGRGRATGTLGSGGATLRLVTVNGSIRIR